MRKIILLVLLACSIKAHAQSLITPFEQSNGINTTTYPECIRFYQKLSTRSRKVFIKPMGMSDAGFPFHLVLYANDARFDPVLWHLQKKVIILIINGIHPGEPDGIDASMKLLRDLTNGTLSLPDNIVLAVVPIYNIGGALNRNAYSRVNQDGPPAYGFRGNAQNLDLNRDFTKCDSRNARSFTQIFHWLDPAIQIDTHVSDGADYQHTMTLITTQWNKLGGELGTFVHDVFDPAIYQAMQKKAWPMCPYVNVEDESPENGWTAFYDPPRYSSGYAALFNTISFMAETHMLKPFKDRVAATYALLETIIGEASRHARSILEKRNHNILAQQQQHEFAMAWAADSTRSDLVTFKGYDISYTPSEVTGKMRLSYDHKKPYVKQVKWFNDFHGTDFILSPKAYLVPCGWHDVIDLLRLNHVTMTTLGKDSTITVQAYHIDHFNSSTFPYEKHHPNTEVHITPFTQTLTFLKGDYIIPTAQPAKRFLMEMLEPIGQDSYFSWNFFDAVLQQKEGYSDYRWEDVAAEFLQSHPEVRSKLQKKKESDSLFSQDVSAQLEFVYKNSPYYEPAHLKYPIFRIL